MKKSLEKGLTPQFAQDIDLVSTIISIFEYLIKEKQYEQVLELQALVNTQEPEVLGSGKKYKKCCGI